MSRLEDLLNDAADGPVRFDHRDIARRVRHRRTGRLAAVAAVVVLGVVGFVAGFGDDSQEVDSVGTIEDGAVTVDELVADRWVAFAYSEVIVAPSPPAFLQFDDDGRLGGIDGCRPINGDWELDGTRLVTSLEPMGNVACDNQPGGLTELLENDPRVGRFDDGSETLKLTAGDDFVAFQRFDRLGEAPSATTLEGRWSASTPAAEGEQEAPAVTFDPDGTGSLEIFGCSQPLEWSVDGDALAVDGLDPDGMPCNGGVVGGGLLLSLTSDPRLRVDGSLLWLSSDLGIDQLHSDGTGAAPSSTTTAPDGGQDAQDALERAAGSIRYVAASPDGVTLHDGGGSQRIASEDAAVAYAIGSDIVVHQPASTTFTEYPPTPEGTPTAWLSGEERALPVSPDARSTRLLDATVLDGVPVALVAESYGGVGPDDTFEELALIDIADGTRSTVVRRPAWESAHLGAAVLPDGDVIGLFASESLVLLARWSPGEADPAWVVEVAVDSRPTLTTVDGQIRVVDAGFDEDFAPMLRIRAYDTNGQEQSDESVPVADPDRELGAGLFCTGWYDATHLLCGRSDGPPILISLTSGTYRQTDSATGSYPTVSEAP
ncbi:META domain-containing protein [Acidimicrobiia bacterium EGI L10123]|uniref:META domain-containing protein n=1 Tax=Salinilacustrithrix flava TaxID=2957203 RepID=UPI003D7C1803|nr:META domain-containing protein [Acidimicrobiia bacterium EGI L10123]